MREPSERKVKGIVLGCRDQSDGKVNGVIAVEIGKRELKVKH